MKRIIALILAALAILTLAACSNGESKDTDKKANDTTNNTPANDTTSAAEPVDTDPEGTEPADTDSAGSAYADAVAVLEAAWAAYPEDDKFPVYGGSTDVAVEYDGKPGPFTMTMTDEMGNSLHVPADIMPQIKSAASMIHMMNANTFTTAVFEVEGDINAFSTALVDGVNSTQWVCGIPETVITVKVDNYLIMAFGNGEIIENYKTAAMTAVNGASLVHEGPISFGGGGIPLPF